MLSGNDYRYAVEECDLYQKGFTDDQRETIARHAEDASWNNGDAANASISDFGTDLLDDEQNRGTSLILPRPNQTLAFNAKSNIEGQQRAAHRLIVDKNGTAVVGWSSGAVDGAESVTQAPSPIDLPSVLRLESAGEQHGILTPSLYELIQILGLERAQIAEVLKLVNGRLDSLLQFATQQLRTLSPNETALTAPNLTAALLDRIPVIGEIERATLEEGTTVSPHYGVLTAFGPNTEGAFFVGVQGVAKVKTGPGEWHIAYPSKTIRPDAAGEGIFISSKKNGHVVRVRVDVNDPAVVAAMNLQQARSAAHTANKAWLIEDAS